MQCLQVFPLIHISQHKRNFLKKIRQKIKKKMTGVSRQALNSLVINGLCSMIQNLNKSLQLSGLVAHAAQVENAGQMALLHASSTKGMTNGLQLGLTARIGKSFGLFGGIKSGDPMLGLYYQPDKN